MSCGFSLLVCLLTVASQLPLSLLHSMQAAVLSQIRVAAAAATAAGAAGKVVHEIELRSWRRELRLDVSALRG